MDYEKLKAARGEQVKVKLQGRFRRGTIVATGKHKETGTFFIRVRLNERDIPWGGTLGEPVWTSVDNVRKADKAKWE